MADTVTCIQQIVMNLNWYCLNPPELKYKLVKILLPIVSVCGMYVPKATINDT